MFGLVWLYVTPLSTGPTELPTQAERSHLGQAAWHLITFSGSHCSDDTICSCSALLFYYFFLRGVEIETCGAEQGRGKNQKFQLLRRNIWRRKNCRRKRGHFSISVQHPDGAGTASQLLLITIRY